MSDKFSQKDIEISGDNSKSFGRDDNSTINIFHSHGIKKGKLFSLFGRLRESFENEEQIFEISQDLKRYTNLRDTIGLEEKLKAADKEHYFDDFSWLKQEFHKKLVLYQNYEPAQEIFALILAIVLERYRNLVKPMILEDKSESEIQRVISNEIVNPILKQIDEEGCDDIIGLTSTEIDGMFHYLTGNCHIKWTK